MYIILTGNITLTKKAKIEFMRNRLLAFKYNASLPIAYQRSICLNTVKITKKQQAESGIITWMNLMNFVLIVTMQIS